MSSILFPPESTSIPLPIILYLIYHLLINPTICSVLLITPLDFSIPVTYYNILPSYSSPLLPTILVLIPSYLVLHSISHQSFFIFFLPLSGNSSIFLLLKHLILTSSSLSQLLYSPFLLFQSLF